MKKLIVTGMLTMSMLGIGYTVHAAPAATAKAKVNWATDPLRDAHKVDFKSLPLPVREAVHKHIGNNSHVEDVDEGKINGRTIYEVAFKKDKKSNKTYELRLMTDGTVMGEHAD
jgi:hypothetical protein